MKNAFIIHGFNGDTTYTFGPWLKNELEKRNYNVIMPEFPIRSLATFNGWANILDEYKDLFNQDTVVVCHSIGNPFIIKYLNKNHLKAKLYVSVAGFCKLFTIPDREDLNKAFIDFKVSHTDIDYCKKNIEYRFSLYSDTDRVVPFDVLENFVKELNSNPVFIPVAWHMGNKENTTKLPQIIDILDKLRL